MEGTLFGEVWSRLLVVGRRRRSPPQEKKDIINAVTPKVESCWCMSFCFYVNVIHIFFHFLFSMTCSLCEALREIKYKIGSMHDGNCHQLHPASLAAAADFIAEPLFSLCPWPCFGSRKCSQTKQTVKESKSFHLFIHKHL